MMLGERYVADRWLPEYYRKNLLEPGWAGALDNVEFAYIKSELTKSRPLKRRWGFRPSARRLSESRIRAVAMYGVTGRQK
jgi:hypothetical protein